MLKENVRVMPIKKCPRCGCTLKRNRKGGHRLFCIGGCGYFEVA